MTDYPKPPPYRRRLEEGDEGREEKLTDGQLADRDRVIRSLLGILALWAYSGLVFLAREVLPGGNYPFPFSYVPSFLAWPVVLVCAVLWVNDRGKRKWLFLVLTLLLVTSLAGSLFKFLFTPLKID